MSKDGPETVILEYQKDEPETDRRRLVGVIGAASTLLVLILIVALFLGSLGALGIGIGGFLATFGVVDADAGGVIYPTLEEQGQCEKAPQLMASLDGEVAVQNHFGIQKDIPIPGSPMGIDSTRIDIITEIGENASVLVEDLDLRLIALNAESTVFGNGSLTEFTPDRNNKLQPKPNDSYAPTDAGISPGNLSSFSTEFGVDVADGFELHQGRVLAYQIAFGNIEITSATPAITLKGISEENSTASKRVSCDKLGPETRERKSDVLVDFTEEKPYVGDRTDVTKAAKRGFVDVEIEDTDEPVPLGGELDVGITLENTEGERLKDRVTLIAPNGEIVDVREVLLGPNQTASANLRWNTDVAYDPEYPEIETNPEQPRCFENGKVLVREQQTCTVNATQVNRLSFDGVELRDGARLRFVDDITTSVTGEIDIGNDSEIVVEDSLKLGSRSDIDIGDGATIRAETEDDNKKGDPGRIEIMSWGGDVNFGSADVVGILRLDNGILEVPEGAEIHGGVATGDSMIDVDINGKVSLPEDFSMTRQVTVETNVASDKKEVSIK